MNNINTILIANRGEIAIRIMRTCELMGITTIAIFSDEDENALFTELADIAVPLNGESLADTYLNIDKIIAIAKQYNADAIHPGYGFMSENEQFVQACNQAELIFIGPSAESIKLMGDKVASRKFAKEHGVPLLEGIEGSHDELLAKKGELHYPVIIKASAGGGGKGMRVVETEKELPEALEATAREAKSYFGNDEVFIERYIQNPRHIEVQILGDQHGKTLHLFERECTIQRRHQKIIEEAPSISLNTEQRKAITQSAIKLAKAANYFSAGTVEFIVDEDLNFYFMEMNTRIQVEHPVSENITGIDIVEQQINIAKGEAITIEQEDVEMEGHSIECRIYAEDPTNNFRPSPGKITYYSAPEQLPLTRLDAALNKAQIVSGSYDPMIAKLITWGKNREDAIETMKIALNNYVIEGIPTNIEYLKAILADQRFIDNNITTNYCKEFTDDLLVQREQEKKQVEQHIPLIACLLFSLQKNLQPKNIWEQIGFYRLQKQIQFQQGEEQVAIHFNENENDFYLQIKNQQFTVTNVEVIDDEVWFALNGEDIGVQVHKTSPNTYVAVHLGYQFKWTRTDELDTTKNYEQEAAAQESGDSVSSPIPGTVVKVMTKSGDNVKKGDALIIVEAMKMENTLTASRDAEIESIEVNAGEKVDAGQHLIIFKQENNNE